MTKSPHSDDFMLLVTAAFLFTQIEYDMTTSIIFLLLFFVAYAIFDGMADAYIFLENRAKLAGRSKSVQGVANYNTLWHRMQALQQLNVLVVPTIVAGEGWPVMLAGAAAFWIIHDGIVNLVGLKRTFFYVGTTAFIDRMFQKTGRPELFMALAKFISLGVGLFFILK